MGVKRLLAAMAFLGAMAFGQAGRYDNISIGLTANNLYTVTPNATVQLYVYPGPTTNCAGGGCTLATTFTSETAGSSCGTSSPLTRPGSTSCVGTVDAGGNYGFWAESGKYQACITAAGFGTNCTNIEITSNYTTVPGVFTNTQMNQSFLVLVGGIPSDMYHSIQGFPGYTTSAGTFGVAIPSNAGIGEAEGVQGMVTSSCNSLGRTKCNAVAVSGHAEALASNAAVWGINTTTSNHDAGLTGLNIVGIEADEAIAGDQSGGYVHGVDIFLTNAPGSTMPTGANSAALGIGSSISANGKWDRGVWVQGTGVISAAFFADQLCNAGSGPCNSPNIALAGMDSGNNVHIGNAFVDSAGNWNFTSAVTSAELIPPSATFAQLAVVTNGGVLFCSNCNNTADDGHTAGAGCTSTSGHGALAIRQNNAWRCY